MIPVEYYRLCNTAKLNEMHVSQICEKINELFKRFIQNTDCMVSILYDTDLDGASSCGLFMHYLKKKIEKISNPQLRTFNVSCQATPHGIGIKEELEASFKRFAGIENLITVVLDHGLTAELNQIIQASGRSVVWIDHHTVYEKFEINDDKLHLLLSNTDISDHSTVGMVFQLYKTIAGPESTKPDPEAGLAALGEAVAIVEYYDTGKAFGNREDKMARLAKGLNEFFYLSGNYDPKKSFPMEMLAVMHLFNPETGEFSQENLHHYIAEGLKFLEVKETIVENVVLTSMIVKQVEFPEFEKPITTGIVYHSDSRNEISEAIFEKRKDVNLVVVVSTAHRGEKRFTKITLRTRRGTGIDAGKIASAYGGGGHLHASGFYLDFENTYSNPIFS